MVPFSRPSREVSLFHLLIVACLLLQTVLAHPGHPPDPNAHEVQQSRAGKKRQRARYYYKGSRNTWLKEDGSYWVKNRGLHDPARTWYAHVWTEVPNQPPFPVVKVKVEIRTGALVYAPLYSDLDVKANRLEVSDILLMIWKGRRGERPPQDMQRLNLQVNDDLTGRSAIAISWMQHAFGPLARTRFEITRLMYDAETDTTTVEPLWETLDGFEFFQVAEKVANACDKRVWRIRAFARDRQSSITALIADFEPLNRGDGDGDPPQTHEPTHEQAHEQGA